MELGGLVILLFGGSLALACTFILSGSILWGLDAVIDKLDEFKPKER